MYGYYRKKLQVSLRVKEPVISYPGGRGWKDFWGDHMVSGGERRGDLSSLTEYKQGKMKN